MQYLFFKQGLIKNDEIVFIDHNKYENSFRDMQLMTYSKVIINGGNSGFSRLAAVYSDRCEMFISDLKSVMELHERIRRKKTHNNVSDGFVMVLPEREHTEWLNFWFDKANTVRNNRILLIGDSVARDYRGPLAALTGRPVDFFATSTSIGDEMFWKMLELFFSFKEYKQQKAHIQIGVHSINGFGAAKRTFSTDV